MLYQLEGGKEMLPDAVIVTSLIFQFLLQFNSYMIVHFILGNFCTLKMLPPNSKKCFDSFGLNYKMTYLTSMWQP